MSLKLTGLLLVIMLALSTSVSSAHASSHNGGFIKEDQKQVVAYYPSPSDHTVILPNGDIAYNQIGFDVVKKNGKSGNFQQWYFGDDGTNYHSVWKVQKNDKCPNSSVEIEQAYNPPDGDTWGDYLEPDADYCVKTNEF